MTSKIALDTVFTNVRIVDVASLKIFEGWIGVLGGKFIYVEEGEFPSSDFVVKQISEGNGRYVIPGFVDSHMHIESSLLIPERFEEAVLPCGTTTILNDPHEVANVSGVRGVKWFIHQTSFLNLRVYHAIPSCVPASSPELEWTAHTFGESEVKELIGSDNVIALGEVMDYRRVLAGDKTLKAMVDTALNHGLRVEGHIPTLSGSELSRYISWGITSDHTLMTPDRIRERIRRGVYVMLQMKSLTEENIEAVMSLKDRSAILLVTDDVEPSMLDEGHLSSVVRGAVEKGMPLLEAIASASVRPARYLGLRNFGLIAPGYQADFLIMDDLTNFKPSEVYIGGKLVARNGTCLGEFTKRDFSHFPTALLPELSIEDFALKTEDFSKCRDGGFGFYAVTVENDENSLTSLERICVRFKDGFPAFGENSDLAFVGVFARNGRSKSLGFIKNLGLRDGAYASTFQHDSHNLLVLGRSVEDMVVAARAVREMGGGIVVVRNRDVIARLPLAVMGILSDSDYRAVSRNLAAVEKSLKLLGIRHKRPFLFLSVLCLSVSPYFKFSDRGIIDTEKRALVGR